MDLLVWYNIIVVETCIYFKVECRFNEFVGYSIFRILTKLLRCRKIKKKTSF